MQGPCRSRAACSFVSTLIEGEHHEMMCSRKYKESHRARWACNCPQGFISMASCAPVTDSPSRTETEYSILTSILENANKRFVCPICYSSFSEPRTALSHCRKRRDAVHKGIGNVRTNNDFGNFRRSLGIAVGWEDIPVERLPLNLERSGSRNYGDCLGLDFILETKTRQEPSNTAMKNDILREIVRKAGFHYACPLCLSGFAGSDQFFNHCDEETGEDHRNLRSEDLEIFLEAYRRSMGQSKLDCEILQLEFDATGTPIFFGECFQLKEVIKYKRKSPTKFFYEMHLLK